MQRIADYCRFHRTKLPASIRAVSADRGLRPARSIPDVPEAAAATGENPRVDTLGSLKPPLLLQRFFQAGIERGSSIEILLSQFVFALQFE